MSQKIDKHNGLDELKDLLIKEEKEKIQRIERRLDDPMVRAKEISQFLPEAISLSLIKGSHIPRVLQPVIDESIKISVKNNPETIATAISPALGPGIRKAITSTLMGMIQSLNHVLNHSFSIQGIKWRFEAFKSHKQFAEIVLLHTLVYRVEQIFLIHINTGLVLEHVVAGDIISQDPDLVSGMLTAIQDFVEDSFQTNAGDEIETLRMGSDRSIWIEHGEHAMIAAVIRGNPPLDLRIKYRELLEEIHMKSGMTLENFDGDTLPFSIFRKRLEEGLEFKEKKMQKRISPLLACIFIIIFLISVMWGVNVFKTRKSWHQYLLRLKNQKGLIVLSAQKENGKYHIYGLRDPMVKDAQLLPGKKLEKNINVTFNWKTYCSLDPEFILKRANRFLKPPSTIKINLSGNIISAMGEAHQAWIEKFRKTAMTIPGIHGFNDKMIKNIDMNKLDAAVKKLAAVKLYFQSNSTKFIKGQEKILAGAVDIIKKIRKLQSKVKTNIEILIMGHTDSSGSERVNRRLSLERARKIFNLFIFQGIPPDFLTPIGIGNKIVLAKENSKKDRQYNRAITFKIFYKNLKTGQVK